MPFHFINQLCHRLSDQEYCSWSYSLQSFVISCSLYIEEELRVNSSYARSTLNIHNNFAVAFLKSNHTVGHVPMMEILPSLSWQWDDLHHQSWFCVSASSGGKQKHLERLFAKLKAKSTKLNDSLSDYST